MWDIKGKVSNDVDKDTSATLSDKVLVITNRLLKEHILKYNTVDG